MDVSMAADWGLLVGTYRQKCPRARPGKEGTGSCFGCPAPYTSVGCFLPLWSTWGGSLQRTIRQRRVWFL